MESELGPVRERAIEVRARSKELDEILGDGAERARSIAGATIREVKELMGLSNQR